MAGIYLHKLLEGLDASFQTLEPSLMNQVMGRDIYPKLNARLLCLTTENPNLCAYLDELPSETTPMERRLLFGFFSRFWGGQGNVLEIGPFLGGTSRAIAYGMLKNPRALPEAALYTFDRFSNYYDAARMLQTLQPMITKGSLSREKVEGLGKEAHFLEIFQLLHQNQPYAKLLFAREGVLPDSVDEVSKLEHPFRPPEGKRFDVVFVDGCKSWFGTKTFMRQVISATNEGGYFIFQDYGWFTCFWVPAFVGLFSANFELVAYVDNTYAFQYKKTITPADIDRFFPDAPEGLGQDVLERLFGILEAEAVLRSDTVGLLNYTLQHLAALAYIGDKEKARAMMSQVEKNPAFQPYSHLISMVKVSPTYRPEGKVYL